MNTANQVAEKINEFKRMVSEKEMSLSEAVFESAKLCVGWSYVYGAWGAYCTPSERKKRQGYHPEKTEITKKCQVLNGSKASCTGCKWYPNDERTRCYDCRGFTDWCLNQFGEFGVVDLYGDSVGRQWGTASNWRAQGTIDTIPDDILVCLFVKKGDNWNHTGLGYKGASCECGSGVEYYDVRKSKWTHWAIPKGIEGEIMPKNPTLRKGSSGEWVKLLQNKLINKGYDVGSYGADGKFGTDTEAAVKEFQRDWGLTVDGIVGAKTWEMLDTSPSRTLYTVHIPYLPLDQAEALLKRYPGSTKEEERG